MKLNKKIFIILFTLIISSLPIINAHGNCGPGYALSMAKWRSFGKIKHVVAVEPFVNQSKNNSGAWLSNGLPELIGNMLASGKKVAVMSGITRQYPPAGVQPEFVITGTYQNTPTTLSVYLRVFKAGSGEAIDQIFFSIAPPNTGHLFIEAHKAVKKLFDSMKIAFDKKRLEEITDETSNFMAYQNYISGLEAMWQFNPNYYDVAAIWFREARKHDIYFQKAYTAEEDMYGEIALQAKTSGLPYVNYLQKIEDLENKRLQFLKRPPTVAPDKPRTQKKVKEYKIANRFLLGNELYIAGESALQEGNEKGALKSFHQAVKYVPEDITIQNQLYNIYLQKGNQSKADEIMNNMSRCN